MDAEEIANEKLIIVHSLDKVIDIKPGKKKRKECLADSSLSIVSAFFIAFKGDSRCLCSLRVCRMYVDDLILVELNRLKYWGVVLWYHRILFARIEGNMYILNIQNVNPKKFAFLLSEGLNGGVRILTTWQFLHQSSFIIALFLYQQQSCFTNHFSIFSFSIHNPACVKPVFYSHTLKNFHVDHSTNSAFQ